MWILLLVLIVFAIIWWRNATYQEDLTKADYLNKYGQADFVSRFGQKELDRLRGIRG